MGMILWRGEWHPLQYSCLENPRRQRNLAGYSLRGHKESAVTEHARRAIGPQKPLLEDPSLPFPASVGADAPWLVAASLQASSPSSRAFPSPRLSLCHHLVAFSFFTVAFFFLFDCLLIRIKIPPYSSMTSAQLIPSAMTLVTNKFTF